MPELPEVETIVRDLRPVLKGKKIVSYQVKKRRLLRSPATRFNKFMIKARIGLVKRRGKMILFELSSGYTLIIHLKMTGQLVWVGKISEKVNIPTALERAARREIRELYVVGGHPIEGVARVPNRYTYITLQLNDGAKLYFNDTRTFGYWQLVESKLLSDYFSRLGPEPLSNDFTVSVLKQCRRTHPRTTIKALLLNQEIVVGLGNIYVDESLFAAGIKPTRRVAKLSTSEMIKLYKAIRQVLGQAIAARGTSFNSYRDGMGLIGGYWDKLSVYGRRGEPCQRCHHHINRIKLAGRGTHYCPNCQR